MENYNSTQTRRPFRKEKNTQKKQDTFDVRLQQFRSLEYELQHHHLVSTVVTSGITSCVGSVGS